MIDQSSGGLEFGIIDYSTIPFPNSYRIQTLQSRAAVKNLTKHDYSLLNSKYKKFERYMYIRKFEDANLNLSRSIDTILS